MQCQYDILVFFPFDVVLFPYLGHLFIAEYSLNVFEFKEFAVAEYEKLCNQNSNFYQTEISCLIKVRTLKILKFHEIPFENLCNHNSNYINICLSHCAVHLY